MMVICGYDVYKGILIGKQLNMQVGILEPVCHISGNCGIGDQHVLPSRILINWGLDGVLGVAFGIGGCCAGGAGLQLRNVSVVCLVTPKEIFGVNLLQTCFSLCDGLIFFKQPIRKFETWEPPQLRGSACATIMRPKVRSPCTATVLFQFMRKRPKIKQKEAGIGPLKIMFEIRLVQVRLVVYLIAPIFNVICKWAYSIKLSDTINFIFVI